MLPVRASQSSLLNIQIANAVKRVLPGMAHASQDRGTAGVGSGASLQIESGGPIELIETAIHNLSLQTGTLQDALSARDRHQLVPRSTQVKPFYRGSRPLPELHRTCRFNDSGACKSRVPADMCRACVAPDGHPDMDQPGVPYSKGAGMGDALRPGSLGHIAAPHFEEARLAAEQSHSGECCRATLEQTSLGRGTQGRSVH